MPEPDDFDIYFQELLEVPWDEYLAFDEELELNSPATAPDMNSYLADESTENDPEPEPETPPLPSHEDAINHLSNVRKLLIEDEKAFKLTSELIKMVQRIAVSEQITNKKVQSDITQFFKK